MTTSHVDGLNYWFQIQLQSQVSALELNRFRFKSDNKSSLLNMGCGGAAPRGEAPRGAAPRDLMLSSGVGNLKTFYNVGRETEPIPYEELRQKVREQAASEGSAGRRVKTTLGKKGTIFFTRRT